MSTNSSNQGSDASRSGTTTPQSSHLDDPEMLHDDTMHPIEPIAIIGMSCRLPGSASNLSGFWEMIRAGRTAWTSGPGNRFNMKAFQDPSGLIGESTNVGGAHFLKGDIAAFDASFFGINALEANAMDPQHRLLLEIAYESFENAGIAMDALWGSATGVYVGQWTTDYHEVATRDISLPPKYLVTGTGPAISSNRISYFFNLHGPSFTVDTGCSSSLVALHQAIHSLRSGEASQCFVGGVNLLLDPQRFVYQSKLSMFSKEGRSFSFDDRANGYGRGEGCTGIVLKTLSAALRDGDNIRAVIRNSSLTQDGRTPGITVPSAEAQTKAILRAYQQISVPPRADYIEAHGTGTKVGDPIEVGAIAAAFEPKCWSKDPLPVGSVKGNIGHTEAAAGLAGLIKAVLMLENQMVPPQANYKITNPKILLAEWNMRIPTKLEPQSLSRISVNSFGYGGTNAHVIIDHLASALSELSLPCPYRNNLSPLSEQEVQRVFLLSAASEKSCRMMCQNLGRYLAESSTAADDSSFALRLARTLDKRSLHPYRIAFVASNSQDLAQKLMASESLPISKSDSKANPCVAFVFSGQGAQYAQMGRQLLTYPQFQLSMEKARDHLARLGCPWDLLDELSRPAEKSRIDEPAVSQPSCTAIQVALVDLLASFGISPHAVIGHSSGEIAAAYAAGIVTFEDALAISYFRGKVTKELLAGEGHQPGAMLAVGAEPDFVKEYIRNVPESYGEIRIACFNSPRSVTVSGDVAAIDKLKESLDAGSYFNRKLKTNGAAYHSHHMKEAEKPYAEALECLAIPSEPSCRLFSTVSGEEMIGSTNVVASYWTNNLLSPVRFSQALDKMLDQVFDDSMAGVLLEIGPHSQLGGPVKQIVQAHADDRSRVKYMSCLARGKDAEITLLETLSQLHIQGQSVPLHSINRYNAKISQRLLVDLPPYPFNRDKVYWHESRISKNYRHRKHLPHELLGTISPDLNPLEPQWRHFLSLKQSPWLRNHIIQGQIIFPAAAYLTMAMQAAKQHTQLSNPTAQIGSICLRNVSIGKALLLSETGPDVEIVLSLRPQPKSAHESSTLWKEFRIFSVSPENKWSEHCRGLVQALFEAKESSPVGSLARAIGEVGEMGSHPVSGSNFYQLCRGVGIDWQESFENLTTVQTGSGSSVANACAAMSPSTGGTGDSIHPSTLDSVLFQGYFGCLLLDNVIQSPAVPTFIKELILVNKPVASGSELVATAVSTSGHYTYDVAVQNAGGLKDCVIKATGVTVTKLPGKMAMKSEDVCFDMDLVPYLDCWKPESINKFCNSSEFSDLFSQVAKYCHSLGMQTPHLKALSIGRDAAASVTAVVQAMNGSVAHDLSNFDIAGIPLNEFEALKESLDNLSDVLEHRDLDLAGNLSHQGFNEGAYDLIVTACATDDSDCLDFTSGSNLKLLLKPGGKLIVLTPNQKTLQQDGAHQPAACPTAWTKLCQSKLEDLGFSNPAICFGADVVDIKDGVCAFLATAPWKSASGTKLPIRFITAPHGSEGNDVVEHGIDLVRAVLPESDMSLERLGSTSSEENMKIILPEIATQLCLNPTDSLWCSFRDLMIKSRIVVMVSTNANEKGCNNADRAIWTGLARSIRQEFPHIRFITMDFADGNIFEKLGQYLPSLLDQTPVFDTSRPANETENEFVEVNGQLFVTRIRALPDRTNYVERMQETSEPIKTAFLDHNRPLEAELGIPGLLETIRWKDAVRPSEIGHDEIRIELRAASINFKDVLIAAGQLPGITTMRNDCSGVVLEVGPGMVERFKPGDRVMALYSQSYTNYPVVHGDCCEIVPANLSFDEAASIPIVWATVYYSLVDMGRLAKGEKLLIHSGAGAVGQAAIMLAQFIGAEVFATVGSESKRQLLHDRFKIPHDHIFSSRTTDFYSEIRDLTNDYGVDVVLNSLSGEAFRKSCELVAQFGRFVEIGRKDLMDDSLMPMSFFLKNVNFSYVDMALIIDVKKPLARRVLQDVVSLLAQGSISPVSLTSMPISEIEAAFRTIQSGKHTGKIILHVEEKQEVKAVPPVPTLAKFLPNATYAVIGGFGGIGRAVIEWMAHNGAQNIVSIGRSGATSQSSRDFVEKMRSKGVNLMAEKCDVTNEAEVASITRRFSEEDGLYPIRGVIQSSVVFDDGLFEQMSVERWWNVLGPKVQGTKNLDICFRENVDFFVIMSSIIALCGNDGQSNYAAACCFQDELARQRVASGLHAFSMNIGPVRDVGWLSERQDVANEVRRRGFKSVSVRDVLAMLNYAITHNADVDSCVCTISPAPYSENSVEEGKKREKRFARLAKRADDAQNNTANADDTIPQLSKAVTLEAASKIICRALLRQLGRLIATPEEDLSVENSLDHYGVDSLIAVEMRNWITVYLQADLSLVAIRGASSIRELAKLIAKESSLVGSF